MKRMEQNLSFPILCEAGNVRFQKGGAHKLTWYTGLQPAIRYFLAGFLFFAVMTELTLCLYQFHRTGKWISCLKNFVIFCAMFLFLTFITSSSKGEQVVYQVRLPWLFLPLCSLLLLLYAFCGIWRYIVGCFAV